MQRGEIQRTRGAAAVILGDTVVSVWQAPLTTEMWRWYWGLISTTAARFPEGALNLSVLLPSSSPPDAGLRREMQRNFRQLGQLRRFVVWPTGSSIWFNVVRAIVRGVLLLSGQSKLQGVAGSLSEAIELLQRAAGPSTPERETLAEAVAELCTVLGIERLEAA